MDLTGHKDYYTNVLLRFSEVPLYGLITNQGEEPEVSITIILDCTKVSHTPFVVS